MTEAAQAVWLYAVTRRDDCGSPPSIPGVAGETVRVLSEDPLAAVIGSVDARQFSAEALARNLENLDWLADTARAHDAVVAAVAQGGPVVPVRLATLFGGEEGVRELLHSRRDDFNAALDAVTDRAEWGVKAFLDPDALAEHPPDDADRRQTVGGGRPAAGGAGSAYLMRRRAQLAARQSAESAAAQWARQIRDRLDPLCAASRLHPAQDPRLTGRRDWMILNAAYLVDLERSGTFQEAVREFSGWRPGLEVQLTGPWPPYSFAVAPGTSGAPGAGNE